MGWKFSTVRSNSNTVGVRFLNETPPEVSFDLVINYDNGAVMIFTEDDEKYTINPDWSVFNKPKLEQANG